MKRKKYPWVMSSSKDSLDHIPKVTSLKFWSVKRVNKYQITLHSRVTATYCYTYKPGQKHVKVHGGLIKIAQDISSSVQNSIQAITLDDQD